MQFRVNDLNRLPHAHIVKCDTTIGPVLIAGVGFFEMDFLEPAVLSARGNAAQSSLIMGLPCLFSAGPGVAP
ncbi:MAG: hypothetical protein WAN20_21685 [Pseudonocardiaceae bacterium]